jgi:hypothetical protein
MQVAGWIAKIIREEKPAKVNIDVGGLGAGIYDRLVEQGYGGSFGSGQLNAVNFGSKPVNSADPAGVFAEQAHLRERLSTREGRSTRLVQQNRGLWGRLRIWPEKTGLQAVNGTVPVMLPSVRHHVCGFPARNHPRGSGFFEN